MTLDTMESLAHDALALAKNSLLVSLRFMAPALSQLKELPRAGSTLATDGLHLRYDPEPLLELFTAGQPMLTRAYLHIILHNVFLHLYPGPDVDPDLWDAACDIVVEGTIDSLDLPATRTSRAKAARANLELIADEAGLLTAERVYHALLDRKLAGMTPAELAVLRSPFFVDDHSPWHAPRLEEQQASASASKGEARESGAESRHNAQQAAPSGTDMDAPEEAADAEPNHKAHRAMDSADITQKQAPEDARRASGGRMADTVNLDRSRERWENAALEMGLQLDSYARLWGVEGSNLSMNLRKVTREKKDYRTFLRKFARMGEQIRVNDDEFDYVFYCYGLDRYGNLPLVEPVEFAEEKRIRDFVIAIDTSASTKDGLVRKFLERTYSILSDEASFFTAMNVWIIQCDAAVTDVARIKSLRDLDDYLKDLQVHGLGGTDFRPVFTYVEAAVDKGDLHDLGGLIYFTDGQGAYPKHRPSFETAFVFLDSDDAAASAPVPPWAMKVVLDEIQLVDTLPLGKELP